MVGLVEIAVSRRMVFQAQKRLTHQRSVVESSTGPMNQRMQEVRVLMQAKLDRLIAQHERLVGQAGRTIPCLETF